MERKLYLFLGGVLSSILLTACSNAEKKPAVEPPATMLIAEGRLGVIDADNGRVDLITCESKHSRSVESFRTTPDTKVTINKSPGNSAALQSGMEAKVAYKYLLTPRGEYDKVAMEIVSSIDRRRTTPLASTTDGWGRKW